MDESVSALDTSVRTQILSVLKDLQWKFKSTYVFVTHDECRFVRVLLGSGVRPDLGAVGRRQAQISAGKRIHTCPQYGNGAALAA